MASFAHATQDLVGELARRLLTGRLLQTQLYCLDKNISTLSSGGYMNATLTSERESLFKTLLWSVACCMPLLSVAASAQESAPWYGKSVPPGLGDVHKPIVNVKNATPPPATVPPGEEKFSTLRGSEIYRDVASIVGFSKQSRAAGDKVWGRVTGFPAAKATIDWSAQQLKLAGLSDVAVQEYTATIGTPMWWSKSWEVKLIANAAFGEASRDVVLETAVPTSGSNIDGGTLTAPLVYVGAVTDKLPDVDVRGKIAVQHLRPVNGAFSERTPTVQRAQALTKQGAVAILNVVEQTGNMHVRDFGNCGAPCFNLGSADGDFVEEVLARATKDGKPLTAQLKLQAERYAELKGHNAFGVIPGSSDENIIINAHADGWYDAAGDNADGLAVLIALARHFGQPAHKPRRTLIFVASGGHHSAGLNGPANFVRMNSTLTAKTVLVLNLEHIAQLRIRSGMWTVDGAEQPMNFGIDNSAPAILAAGKRSMERYGFNLNPTFGTSVSGDLGGYAPLGVARVQAIHSGPMYHTSGDTLETISVPGLERAARFYAHFIEEMMKLPRTELNPAKSAAAK